MVTRVKTEYNIGDTVWLVSQNKVVCKKVTLLEINVGDNIVAYEVNCESEYIPEGRLFKSKSELLKSL